MHSQELDNDTYSFLIQLKIHYENAYRALLRSMQQSPKLGHMQMRTLLKHCPELQGLRPNVFSIMRYSRQNMLKNEAFYDYR